MSGFLRDLTARSLGHADVVQPRLPSLYEPVSGQTEGFVEIDEQIEAPTPPLVPAEHTAPLTPPAPLVPPPTPTWMPPPLRDASDSSEVVLPQPPPQRTAPERPLQQPILPLQPAMPTGRGAFEMSPERETPRSSQMDAPLRDLAQPLPPPANAFSSSRTNADEQPDRIVQVIRQMMEPSVPTFSQAVPPKQEPEQSTEPAYPVNQPAVERLIMPAMPASARTTPPAEQSSQEVDTEPVIRVTINRVEVRAIQPSAPQPQQRPASPPRLSLDDYLRSRR